MANIRKNLFFQPKNPQKLIIPKDNRYESVVPGLVKTAKMISSKAEDFEVKNPAAHGMKLVEGNLLSFKFGRGMEERRLRLYALHQLCAKLRMPASFFEYLTSITQTQDLAYLTVNRLLEMYHDDMLVRICDGQIRGLLTPRYSCFDTDRILDVFTSCFDNNPFIGRDDLQVKGYVNDMERFHIRFTNANPIKGVPDKDIEYGLQIDSSDVGKSSIRVRFMVYKQLCTNGLSIGYLDRNLFQHNHTGKITPDEFYHGLRRSFWEFPRIAAQATDIINSAEGYAIGGSGLVDFTRMDDSAKKERKNMQLYLGVSEEALRAIAEIAGNAYRPTSWGYVNAITEYSQRCDFEMRAELERLAGQILSNPARFFAA